MGKLSRYILIAQCFLHNGGYKRAEFLKKKHHFKTQGEHCYLHPWNYGTEPHLISFGNNVHIATNVHFINHDISTFMLQYIDSENKYRGRVGEIVVGDNVFIGAYSTVLYDVHIGNNVVIGAGSIVTKDIPDNVVAAGVPCKPIGSFDDYKNALMITQ